MRSTQRRKDAEKIENRLTEQVIDAAIEVHRTLGGPGLLESLYEEALYQELRLRDIPVEAQVQIPVIYKGCTRTCRSQGTGFDLFAFDRTQVRIVTQFW